jgi:hypothetical protein
MPEPNSGCWIWLGAVDWDNYGIAWDTELKRNARAHRYVYECLVGSVPADKKLLHRCDNSCCVNPDHLFIGTTAENNRDCKAKGRNARGESHGMNKISPATVLAIRDAVGSHSEVAVIYGVSKSLVTKIKARHLWKDLEAP